MKGQMSRLYLNRVGIVLLCFFALCACSQATDKSTSDLVTYDVIIRGGLLYDGSGNDPYEADIGIIEDRIAFIGSIVKGTTAVREVDATGLAVAPGFINVLSWAAEALLVDGRSLGDLKQGVTLEVFGEGRSMGPVNEQMRSDMLARQGDLRFDIPWRSFAGFMNHLEHKGISPNIASFLGATNVRVYIMGHDNRAPTSSELAAMQSLVRTAMEEGALGIGSSLIYAPAFYAETGELIALMQAAADYGGSYISHMRSEGNSIEAAVDELIAIASASGAPAQIYHLKMAGEANWHKLDRVISKVERALASGLHISANMYTYTAGATGLDAMMPPWVQEGGFDAWRERLRDPEIRRKLVGEIETGGDDWENLYLAAGSADRVLLTGFRSDALKPLTGKTLSEVAKMRGQSVAETAMNLVIEDNSQVSAAYFMMSEQNVKRQLALPWVSFGSDAGSYATVDPFTRSNTHPRAYGNFARLLGKYVRDEAVISLAEAIRKLTSLPAEQLSIAERGALKEGYFADIAIFDPGRVRDTATFDKPHQYAEGMVHVFVNGEQVLKDGEHTGALPGRFVKGPGWRPPNEAP